MNHGASRDALVWDATYLSPSASTYSGNPLLDTLPVIKTDKQWASQLATDPEFRQEDRELPGYLRAYKVIQLKALYVPTATETGVARRIDQAIRWGYERRNPIGPERRRILQDSFRRLQEKGTSERLVFGELNSMITLSVMGYSGVGKTTTIEKILMSFPQVIRHPDGMIQIVWLKIDCPKGGDLMALAYDFLGAFDRLLGTSHAVDARRSTFDEFKILAEVAHLCVVYNVGIAVLDELQNLIAKKTENRAQMLNWLQGLVNDIKVPLLIMGTPSLAQLLKPELRHARRACVAGSFEWAPMPLDANFRYLVECVWAYCWLQAHDPLTEQMVALIHEETQGIRAFVIDMFLVCQLYALHHGIETITPDIFKRVARTEFAPVQPMLNALRSKRASRIGQFGDMTSFDVQDEIERYQQSLLGAPNTGIAVGMDASLLAQATAKVGSDLDIGMNAAKELVLRVYSSGNYSSVRALCTAVLKAHFESSSGDRNDAAGP